MVSLETSLLRTAGEDIADEVDTLERAEGFEALVAVEGDDGLSKGNSRRSDRTEGSLMDG